MSFTPADLKAELQTDPKGLGYAAHIATGDDAGLATRLNGTYAGVQTVYRNDIAPRELVQCLVYGSELASLTVQQWQLFQTLLLAGVIDASNANIRAILIGMFPSTTQTYANLVAIAKVAAPSRAAELWGASVRITVSDIATALRGA